MADFAVNVVEVGNVSDHPWADRLSLASVWGYVCVVGKDTFKAGDKAVYIPEGAVVPEDILTEMGLVGKLAGKARNIVKATKIRGILSQGLLYIPEDKGILDAGVGADVGEALGIHKYIEPLPIHLYGDVDYVGESLLIKYDIENIKKHKGSIPDGKQVVYTEKIHGTWCMVGVLREPDERLNGLGTWAPGFENRVLISSKGQAAKGLAFKLNSGRDNVYIQAARKGQLVEFAQRYLDISPDYINGVYVLCEVFGVQDLKYGLAPDAGIDFRVFDLAFHLGTSEEKQYVCFNDLRNTCNHMNVPIVPVLWEGPFSQETLDVFTDGLECVSGEGKHIREGVVVRPLYEELTDYRGNRVIYKSVSADYLTRKQGSEYN